MVVQRGGNADVKGICRSGGLCWWLCATKAETCDMMSNKYSHAVWMMMAGPSEPLYKWRFQITLRCCSQKLWYWASENTLGSDHRKLFHIHHLKLIYSILLKQVQLKILFATSKYRIYFPECLGFKQYRLLCFFKSQNMVMKFNFKRKRKNKRHIWRGKIKIVGKIRKNFSCFLWKSIRYRNPENSVLKSP